jgi:hypothetical protein
MGDFMLFFNSLMIYNTLKTVVSSIEYKAESKEAGEFT